MDSDKSIIIDGCNVAECEFYDDVECNAYRQEYWEPQDNTKDLCKCHPNCYFKQLKRLEAKNKKLKKENKELKQLKDMYFTFYKAKHDDINGIFFKYKQALEDIIKYCNVYSKTEDYVIDQTFNEFLESVFNKINEVLNK